MNRIALVDNLHSEVAVDHRLSLQYLVESLLLRWGSHGQHLIGVVHFHVITTGPEGQGCHVMGDIVTLDDLIIDGLKL